MVKVSEERVFNHRGWSKTRYKNWTVIFGTDPDIPPMAKALFLAMDSIIQQTHNSMIHRDQLMEATGISKETISKYIQFLKEFGAIEVERPDSYINIYTLWYEVW